MGLEDAGLRLAQLAPHPRCQLGQLRLSLLAGGCEARPLAPRIGAYRRILSRPRRGGLRQPDGPTHSQPRRAGKPAQNGPTRPGGSLHSRRWSRGPRFGLAKTCLDQIDQRRQRRLGLRPRHGHLDRVPLLGS